MTPTIFPAQPETYALQLNADTVIRTPVIAWAPDADNPYGTLHPMSARGMISMKGKAILHPCGMVVDSRVMVAFENEDEWAAYADGAPEIDQKPAAKAKPAAKKESAPAEDESGLDLKWTNKVFKTNSFYRLTQGDEIDFVFQVDAEEFVPKQTATVVKIKRDEFMALKKELDVADATDLHDGVYPGMEDLGDFGAEEEEEGDGADLI